jgi:hypothetical protein
MEDAVEKKAGADASNLVYLLAKFLETVVVIVYPVSLCVG